MTIKDVEKRIALIKTLSDDMEAAHSEEDRLFIDVLRAIAKDPSDAQDLAKAALESTKIAFRRVCA